MKHEAQARRKFLQRNFVSESNLGCYFLLLVWFQADLVEFHTDD